MSDGARTDAGRRVGCAVEENEPQSKKGYGELTLELRCSPDINQMLMIIQSPHSLTPSRLQAIHRLNPPDQIEIRDEDSSDDRLLVRFGEDPD